MARLLAMAVKAFWFFAEAAVAFIVVGVFCFFTIALYEISGLPLVWFYWAVASGFFAVALFKLGKNSPKPPEPLQSERICGCCNPQPCRSDSCFGCPYDAIKPLKLKKKA
jgi:hypothetical protein